MTSEKQKQAVKFLLGMVWQGIIEDDKDCIRSHMEDLTYYLGENGLMGSD